MSDTPVDPWLAAAEGARAMLDAQVRAELDAMAARLDELAARLDTVAPTTDEAP